MYLLVAVFVVIIALFHFLPLISQPDYDFISTLKVAHDMGQANTSSPPKTTFWTTTQETYEIGVACDTSPTNQTVVSILYYDFDGSGPEVCVK